MNTEIDILQNKLENYINIGERKANVTMRKIIDEKLALRDYIAPCNKIAFQSNGRLNCSLGGGEPFSVHDNAISQAATKMNVPTTYLRNLAKGKEQWERDLSADILNKHFDNTSRERMLVRSVNGEIRGMLSDRYKKFDSLKLYTTFLEIARKSGCKIARSHKADTRGYIEVVKPEIHNIVTENNGTVNMVIGARIRNSDFGNGALDVSMFQLNVVCLNGLTTKKVMRNVHLGAKLPDDITLSDATYQADTELKALVIKDAIKALFSSATIEEEMARISNASSKVIKIDTEIKKLQPMGVQKSEIAALEGLLMNNDPNDGIQGITAVARNCDNEERKRDLEETAGVLLYK